jgi:hypothetical protein
MEELKARVEQRQAQQEELDRVLATLSEQTIETLGVLSELYKRAHQIPTLESVAIDWYAIVKDEDELQEEIGTQTNN